MDDKRWIFASRVISNQIDRATLRHTLHYRLLPRLQVGVEYNPLASEVAPLFNLHIVSETSARPALILNTSTDRIGTPEGQSFTLTASKDLGRWLKLPVAPYVGVAYGTYEDKARMIGGLFSRFSSAFSSLILFDGVHVHPTFTYSYKQHVFSLLMIRGKHPGLSYSITF